MLRLNQKYVNVCMYNIVKLLIRYLDYDKLNFKEIKTQNSYVLFK